MSEVVTVAFVNKLCVSVNKLLACVYKSFIKYDVLKLFNKINNSSLLVDKPILIAFFTKLIISCCAFFIGISFLLEGVVDFLEGIVDFLEGCTLSTRIPKSCIVGSILNLLCAIIFCVLSAS